MENNIRKKQLIIIMGVTGAIGSAFLEQYGQREDTIIYGISRKAHTWRDFIQKENAALYSATFICSVATNKEECEQFINSIDFESFSHVTYFHCVGAYLFEIDMKGDFLLKNDTDRDGINDECTHLSYDLFRWIIQPLIHATKSKVDCVIFGGLADKHEPKIIQSWWRTMKKVEKFMEKTACNKIGMFMVNITSVLCPHELITRPFVFINTNADKTSWLPPNKLAVTVIRTLAANKNGGFHKVDVFNPWEGFFDGYYLNEHMVPRRLAETGMR